MDANDQMDVLFREITQAKPRAYRLSPLPNELDEKVSQFVNLFLLEMPAGRRRMQRMMNDCLSGILISFAERMASRGVREGSRQRLLDGLAALLMEPFFGEAVRGNTAYLAVLYDAALKIGVDANALFLEAAGLVRNSIAIDLANFTKLTPRDRKLESFRFSESADTDGFRYKSTELDDNLLKKLGIELDLDDL